MLFKTRSASVYGIEAYPVDVEVNLSSGVTYPEGFFTGAPGIIDTLKQAIQGGQFR